mgnify:CR=1 FL=1
MAGAVPPAVYYGEGSIVVAADYFARAEACVACLGYAVPGGGAVGAVVLAEATGADVVRVAAGGRGKGRVDAKGGEAHGGAAGIYQVDGVSLFGGEVLGDCVIDDFGYLGSRGRVAWPEGGVCVASNYATRGGGFYVGVEGVGDGDV